MSAAEHPVQHPWTGLPFLALDCETTGVDPLNDRIVSVAAVEVHRDGSTADAWHTIVDPGVEVPDIPAGMHGITTERARAEGVQPIEAITEVAARVNAHHDRHGGQAAVVMFNAPFDWTLLATEAQRVGVEFPIFAPVLDPLLIDKLLDEYRKGSRKLVAVASHYEVPLSDEDAHGALPDAEAAGRVMWRLLDRFPQLGSHTLASMYLRQVRGAEKKRLSFVEYKRRSDPGFRASTGWPISTGYEVGA